MRLAAFVLLFQALTAPDPAQMEKVPALGYRPVALTLALPNGESLGAPSSVATTSAGHLIVFTRGGSRLAEFDRNGAFVRAFGQDAFTRPHGMRLDADDNVWTTDVGAHTVMKMSPRGEVLLTLGVKGQAGEWNEAAGSRLLNEPTDLALAPSGDIFIVQGHGRGEPRVLRFNRRGALITSWGGRGTGPGQFDIAHSIVIDARGLVHVADRQNRRVQVFDADGTFIRERTYAGLPCGLAIAPDQTMYMVSGFSGQIVKLDASGAPVAATGQPGKGLGQFGEAHYLAFSPSGEIYVADTVNQVLHLFVKQ